MERMGTMTAIGPKSGLPMHTHPMIRAAAAKKRAKVKSKARTEAARRGIRVVSNSNTVSLAITPGGRVGDASPLARPGYKGKRKLSDYEREIAHALMRKRGMPKSRAIAMARGLTNKAAKTGRWGRKGKASPAVVAGSAASVAQRASFAVIDESNFDDFANAVDRQIVIDLTARWKHGFIPLNAEAVAEKEHRKRGGGTGGTRAARVAATQPGGKTPASVGKASATRYHSAKTKASMSRSDLQAHARLHAAAAGRARTDESKAKHLREAQSAASEALTRTSGKTKARNVKRTPPTTETARPKAKSAPPPIWDTRDTNGPDGKIKAHAAAASQVTERAARGAKVERAAVHPETAATKPTRVTKVMSMDPKDIHNEIKNLTKLGSGATAAQKRRLTVLNKEKARRIEAVKIAAHQATEARKLVEKSWARGKEPLDPNTFQRALLKVFPGLRAAANKLRDEDGKLKSKETIKVIIDEGWRELARRVIGPMVGTSFAALGLHIFTTAHGG